MIHQINRYKVLKKPKGLMVECIIQTVKRNISNPPEIPRREEEIL